MHASSTAASVQRARWAGSGSAPGGRGTAGMHAAGACGRPARVLAPVDTQRNVAAADKGPGFIVYNRTEWPLNISLDQVGPLYFETVPKGGRFRRKTGAVWFTVKAAVQTNPDDKITTWDAVWPVATVTVGILAAAATGGAAAAGGIGAGAAAGGAAAGISQAAITSIASTLVGVGFTANSALVVGGAVIGAGTSTAALTAAKAVLADVFSKENTQASMAGQYAGKPWPFKSNMAEYEVTGGPYAEAYTGPPPEGLKHGMKPVTFKARKLKLRRTRAP